MTDARTFTARYAAAAPVVDSERAAAVGSSTFRVGEAARRYPQLRGILAQR